MSYAKAMKHNIRKARKQANNHFGFSTLGENERRRIPILGSAWLEPGQEAERAEFIAKWQKETARMQAANPNLRIVD